jgi:hypothetical protein
MVSVAAWHCVEAAEVVTLAKPWATADLLLQADSPAVALKSGHY